MTKAEYVELLMAHPKLRRAVMNGGVEWTGDEGSKQKACEHAVQLAVDHISTEYDFPFVLGEKTQSLTANQAIHILKGSSDDCRDIISIRRTSDNTVLEEMSAIDFDRKLSGATAPSTLEYWAVIGSQGGFPKIEISGVPTSSTEVEYRYRRRAIDPKEIPNEWADVVVDVALGILDAEWKGYGERSLRRMIDEYERKGGEESRIVMDSQWRKRNVERNKISSGY